MDDIKENEITIKEAQLETGLSRQRIMQAIGSYKLGRKNRFNRWLITKSDLSIIIERKGMIGKKL